MVYTFIKNNYKEGEPIFTSDLAIDGISEENLRYHLKHLTDQGLLSRFESGVYYMPKTDLFGEKMVISAETVALHKYIRRKGERVGFFSGYTLANHLGISTQVPFKEEITSNFAPAVVREVTIKNRSFLVRRPVTLVTEENVFVLQLLDCLKDIDKSSELDCKECGTILTRFAKEHCITREMIDRYISYYPLKVYKAIYDTGVQYVSA